MTFFIDLIKEIERNPEIWKKYVKDVAEETSDEEEDITAAFEFIGAFGDAQFNGCLCEGSFVRGGTEYSKFCEYA